MEPTQAAVGLAWSIPFMLLLAAIAAMPFVNGRWWEKNHRYVALGLGSMLI